MDALREELGVTPAGFLGHSAGEIACGYADGALSRTECVLVAYHRGRMCPEFGITHGLMAAVGLSAEDADARLLAHGKLGCVVACDNSPASTTLSGGLLNSLVHVRLHAAIVLVIHMLLSHAHAVLAFGLSHTCESQLNMHFGIWAECRTEGRTPEHVHRPCR